MIPQKWQELLHNAGTRTSLAASFVIGSLFSLLGGYWLKTAIPASFGHPVMEARTLKFWAGGFLFFTGLVLLALASVVVIVRIAVFILRRTRQP